MPAAQPDSSRVTVLRRLAILALLPLISGVDAPAAAGSGVTAGREPAPHGVIRGAEVGAPVTPVPVDVDLRDLPPPPSWKPGDPVREIPIRHFMPPGPVPMPGAPLPIDPLLGKQLESIRQAVRSTSGLSTPTRSFPGIDFTGVVPPDTVGDVGPDHYVQSVNSPGGTDVRIWDKAEPTPNVLATFTLDALGSGVCTDGLGDGIVLYDREADRWLLSEFSDGGNKLCVYISQTADPVTGGWYFYGFEMPAPPDYPKYAIWSTDANGGQGSFIATVNDGGPGAVALDRGAMILGISATFQRLGMPDLSGFVFQGPTPATSDGPMPPTTGEPAIIMRHRDTEVHGGPAVPGDVLELWSFDVDWVTPANTTLTQLDIDVSDFDSTLCGLGFDGCFPQPGTATTLMPLREIIMNRLQHIQHDGFETLVGSFVVDLANNDQGGIRWFELRRSGGGSWSLYQEGTYSIDADNRWMSAIAMDQARNIAVGYSVVSGTTFPSLRYTGRLATDTPGVMTQAEGTIHAGSASSTTLRNGDYAAMDVDPSDDCTFWFTGMDNTSANWRTQIASFAFEDCGCVLSTSALTVTTQVTGDNEIELGWNDADLASVAEYTIERSRTTGGPYELIATVADTSPGIAGGPDTFYLDSGVSGGTTYYYVVRATDGVSCRSVASNEASETATGSCTLPPLFGGVQGLGTPQASECTLDLSWAAGTNECGGPVSYNVYRGQVPGFTPGPANRVAAGLTGTAFSDFDQLVYGTTYYYIVRSVDVSNGSEDGNVVELAGSPQGPGGGSCTTGNACADNPFVDVQPDNTTTCGSPGFELSAVTTGGTGPFTYQWTRDGMEVPGATAATYDPDDLGAHTYNVKVRAMTCPSFVFDGVDSAITLVNTPFFDGIQSASNPQTATCGVDLSWNAGSTVCDGPVRYFVYRDTTSPVSPTPANLVAAGVLGTGYTDVADLSNLTTYHYLVRAQDATTGQFDSNTAEASATPDGPGGGPQAALNEDFENPASFANWTVTTGPGLHTCGEWALDDMGLQRPLGGSGFYALANNECGQFGFGRTSSTLTSPVIDVDLPDIVNVSLEYDIWYNHDGSETGTVEVFDGSSWVTVWQDPDSDIKEHHSVDITTEAAGNANFQVRFDYQDATQDKWFSVDNVQVIALVDSPCTTAAPGPPAVPDGSPGTAPLRGARLTVTGDTLGVTWDSASCPAADYNLLFGDLQDVAALTFSGAECALGTSGSHTWGSVPASDLFFLVVGADGSGTESSWGLDGQAGERNALTVSGECATTTKDVSNTCP